MNRKQNIATPLLLLLWAAMFCFSVTYTLQKHAAKQVSSHTSSVQNKEKLTPENQGTPVAWTEPSPLQYSSGTTESFFTVYTFPSWSFRLSAFFSSLKPDAVVVACVSAIIRFQIFPNGP
ncbi:hypothetical protein H8S95_11615 [Pontibacter sp. KCTC 32443]|uniref:hypothetical protein n=1 Tax=Pontibacter TaxID=323449 RepID=UPI00164DABE5|nr:MULTISPECIES: hypothetical protein [Pontibacter]MBC5774712.1 hypothetical protein [Pontibacter sp. KCTC 32443]